MTQHSRRKILKGIGAAATVTATATASVQAGEDTCTVSLSNSYYSMEDMSPPEINSLDVSVDNGDIVFDYDVSDPECHLDEVIVRLTSGNECEIHRKDLTNDCQEDGVFEVTPDANKKKWDWEFFVSDTYDHYDDEAGSVSL